MEQVFVRDRLALMLEHFGAVGDPREGCKVRYPLREVLFFGHLRDDRGLRRL